MRRALNVTINSLYFILDATIIPHYKSHTSPLFKALGILNIENMYNIGILILYLSIKNGTIKLYFHNFLVTDIVLVEPQRHNFRHKRRVIIPIPPREYQNYNSFLNACNCLVTLCCNCILLFTVCIGSSCRIN